MTQMDQPFPTAQTASRKGLSNVALSPTTDNTPVNIRLRGAGPSLAFEEDLALGRCFEEPKFEAMAYESVFSNLEISSIGSIEFVRVLLDERHAPVGENLSPTADLGSPVTEAFRVPLSVVAEAPGEHAFSIEAESIAAMDAAERECAEELEDELRNERGRWKYARL